MDQHYHTEFDYTSMEFKLLKKRLFSTVHVDRIVAGSLQTPGPEVTVELGVK